MTGLSREQLAKLKSMSPREAKGIEDSVSAFFTERANSVQKAGGIPLAITKTDYAKAFGVLIDRYVPIKKKVCMGDESGTFKKVEEFQIATGHKLKPLGR
jgi:hypothetical protein